MSGRSRQEENNPGDCIFYIKSTVFLCFLPKQCVTLRLNVYVNPRLYVHLRLCVTQILHVTLRLYVALRVPVTPKEEENSQSFRTVEGCNFLLPIFGHCR